MNTYTISTQSLRAAVMCAATNDIRPHLNGVQLLVRGAQVLIRATTGTLVFEDQQPLQLVAPVDIIIPIETAKALAKLKGATINVQVTLGWWECSGHVFKPVDGKFPDVDRVMPTANYQVDGPYRQFDWSLVALAQSAMRTATGKRDGQYRLQHGKPGLLHIPGTAYPRVAINPLEGV